jgi:hypothetical protein
MLQLCRWKEFIASMEGSPPFSRYVVRFTRVLMF